MDATENQAIVNPCTFKPECKSCKSVVIGDRPVLCDAMKCPDYTPCAKCGRNVPVYGDKTTGKKCAACSKGSRAAQAAQELRESPNEPLNQTVNEPVKSTIDNRKFSVTVPGQPPPEYNDEERAYYEKQWREYEGYYRDPSAYPICHAIILSEIELNHINTMMISTRYGEEGSDAKTKAIDQRQTRIIDAISKLRGQLPEREAIEFSEDEKAISAIYERYAEQKQNRRIGNVSRVLSPEAIALAPCLHFPVGLADILSRLGYDAISIERALGQVVPASELPKDPRTILEALGMVLRENVVALDAISGNRMAANAQPSDLLDDSLTARPPSPFGFPQENDI